MTRSLSELVPQLFRPCQVTPLTSIFYFHTDNDDDNDDDDESEARFPFKRTVAHN